MIKMEITIVEELSGNVGVLMETSAEGCTEREAEARAAVDKMFDQGLNVPGCDCEEVTPEPEADGGKD